MFKEGYRITQLYGNKSPLYDPYHEGLDVCPPTWGVNWMVCSIGEGKVVRVEDNHRIYGVYVTVWYQSLGFAVQYCHLESRAVDIGDWVTEGEPVGKMGSTGRSKGAHVHANFIATNAVGIREKALGLNSYFDGLFWMLMNQGKPESVQGESWDDWIKNHPEYRGLF
jgi:murein DD-endopeptidase MepM/ murein hydrolase activator NlpD